MLELERGIAIDFSGHDGEEAWDKARQLQRKMQQNLKMVKDRLDKLLIGECSWKYIQTALCMSINSVK